MTTATGPRVLVVGPYLPWPLHGGAAVRMYHILKGLAREGHTVDLLCGGTGAEVPSESGLEDVLRDVISYERPQEGPLLAWPRAVLSPLPYPGTRFASSDLGVKLERQLDRETYDLVLVNYLYLADAVRDALDPDIPLVVDEHESSLFWKHAARQGGSVPRRAFAWLNYLKARRAEDRTYPRADAVLTVSEREARAVEDRFTKTHAWVVPNGVDPEHYHDPEYPRDGPERIVMCGAMGVRRNHEAAAWFAEDVFPRIRDQRPAAEFWIVGRAPPKELEQLDERPGIHVTGTVPDVRPYYRQARVVVAPYELGSWTKVKVVEALATGRPLVTTPNGCQGIELEDGVHARIEPDAEGLARATVDLLEDPGEAERMAQAAKKLVDARHSWDAIAADLDARVRTTLL